MTMDSFFNRRAWASDGGSALVELALSLPLLVLLMVGAIDFARVFYVGMELTNAARAGAQYGAYNPAQSVDIAGMQAAAAGSVNITIDNPPMVMSTPTVPSRNCRCATGTEVLPLETSCATPCPNEQHLVVTVTVTTSKTFTLVSGSFPGIPQSVNLVRAATLRVPN
jgi:Flp pilus assembly protein TadG